MALSGNDGYFYIADMSTATVGPGGSMVAKTWYKIKGKAATSGLPANLAVGDVFYQMETAVPVTAASLSSADLVAPFSLTRAAFVTDVPVSGSREKFDETVQIDEVRSYQVSTKPEITGTINGYWLANDAGQLGFVNQFNTVMEATTTGGITKNTPSAEPIHTFLSRYEGTEEAKQIWEYMPMVIDSYQSDKPMEGPQPFSVNYTLSGAERPNTYVMDQ
jgi:hypothetical protein